MFIFKQNNNIVIILLPSVPSFHKEKTTFTIISQNIEFFTLLSIMGFTFAEEDANLKLKMSNDSKIFMQGVNFKCFKALYMYV